MYWLGNELSEEQEIVCDLAVCDTNPEYTVGEYCQFLYNEQVTNMDSAFAAALTETKSSLERVHNGQNKNTKMIDNRMTI